MGSWADPDGIAAEIAIPATARTGSEVGRAGVILDEEAGIKKIIFHPKMMPRIVIADPELTIGLPPQVTAATGMDALSHCVEAWCAPGFHPLADGIAAEGVRSTTAARARFVTGTDLDARGNMWRGSMRDAFRRASADARSVAHDRAVFSSITPHQLVLLP